MLAHDHVGAVDAAETAWCEVLGVESVSSEDDFFTLGGESLAAMRVCNRITKAIGIRVPLRLLFHRSQFADFVAGLNSLADQSELS